MIITFFNQKGGVGKSTLCINSAVQLNKVGKSVKILDLDSQGTAFDWSLARAMLDVAYIPVSKATGGCKKLILSLEQECEVLLIDLRGSDSQENRIALLLSDLVVVPFRSSQADLNVLPKSLSVVNEAKVLNENLKKLLVVTMVPTNFSNEGKEILEICNEHDLAPLAKTLIYDRKVYRDAMYSGHGVVELGNTRAKHEIEIFTEEILNGIK